MSFNKFLSLTLFLIVFILASNSIAYASMEKDEQTPLLSSSPVAKPLQQDLSEGRLTVKKLEVFANELNEALRSSHNLPGVEELVIQRKKDSSRQNLTPEAMKFIKTYMLQLHSLKTDSCNISVPSLRTLQEIPTLGSLTFSNSHLGSSIRYISSLVNVTELNLSGNDLTDDELAVISSFSKLVVLNISWNTIEGKTLRSLGELKNLRDLDLSVNELIGRALDGIQTLIYLTKLNINSAHKNIESPYEGSRSHEESIISAVQYLVNLQILKIGNFHHQKLRTPLLGRTSNCLMPLTQLEELDASGADVDDESLKTIGKLTSLRKLDLGSTKIDGSGLKYLVDLVNLEELSLNGRHIGSGAIHISRLNALVVLNLNGCALDDNDISGFGTLQNLRSLNLSANKIEKGTMYLTASTKLQTLDLRYNCREIMCGDGHGDVILLLDDESVSYLSGLVSLTDLKLGTNRLTPISIDSLGKLTNLKTLEINNSFSEYYVSTDQKKKRIAVLRSRYKDDKNRNTLLYFTLSEKFSMLEEQKNTIERENTIGIFPKTELARLQSMLSNCKIDIEYKEEEKGSCDCCSVS